MCVFVCLLLCVILRYPHSIKPVHPVSRRRGDADSNRIRTCFKSFSVIPRRARSNYSHTFITLRPITHFSSFTFTFPDLERSEGPFIWAMNQRSHSFVYLPLLFLFFKPHVASRWVQSEASKRGKWKSVQNGLVIYCLLTSICVFIYLIDYRFIFIIFISIIKIISCYN